MKEEQDEDAGGRRTVAMTIGEHVAAAIRRPGNPVRKEFGVARQGIQR